MVAGERMAAKAAGLRHYFTGKPCIRGHIDKRMVANHGCMSCLREKALERYTALDIESRRRIRRARKQGYRRWVETHRDRQAAYRKTALEKRPDFWKAHYVKHRERLKEKTRAWYHANAERALKRQKAYAAKQLLERPGHVRSIKQRQSEKRRALQAGVFVEVVDRRIVFKRDKGKCGICRKRVDPKSNWEIDHMIPISKGGAHSYDNVQLAHRKCNRAKSATLPKGQPTLFQVVQL